MMVRMFQFAMEHIIWRTGKKKKYKHSLKFLFPSTMPNNDGVLYNWATSYCEQLDTVQVVIPVQDSNYRTEKLLVGSLLISSVSVVIMPNFTSKFLEVRLVYLVPFMSTTACVHTITYIYASVCLHINLLSSKIGFET